MENTTKLEKLLRTVYFSFLAALLLVLLSSSAVNINYAKLIQAPENLYEIQSKELPYTFKIADKLNGDGLLTLSIEENKIKGIANGTGKVSQCNVDFLTNILGNVDFKTGKINIEVTGTGNPQDIPLPGKITFKGPLKGTLDGEKICLTGIVDINGYLALTAGFNNTENVEIEISDPYIAKVFKLLKLKNNLASL